MKKIVWAVFMVCIIVFVFLLYVRKPFIAGKITGQTIYLSFQNLFHAKDTGDKAQFMLIDDDSGPGIFKIHEICERVGVKATFAVVPAFLDSARCDSLRKWHDEGYGIALHGYNHGKWKDWTTEEISNDIDKCLEFLNNRGFRNVDSINLIVVPSFYNTSSIREAIQNKGMKMILGGNVVNPDNKVFIWGRLFITNNTDVEKIRLVLQETKDRKYSIVFGTHSSIPDEFSAEKTEKILLMAKEMLNNLQISE